MQVHDHDVGGRVADDPERLGSRPGFADDRDALLFEQVPEAGAEEIVVVDEKDADVALLAVLYRFGLAQRKTPATLGETEV